MNYLEYLWRAKGRHGTHSPFIYGLVENALHSKGNSKKNLHSNGESFSKKLVNTIWNVASYLKLDCAFIDEKAKVAYPFLNQFVGFSAFSNQLSSPNRILLVTSVQNVEGVISTFSISNETEIAILVLHFNNGEPKEIETLYKLNMFNLTVFAWDFSILMYNKDFKRKQHFVLR